MVYPSSTMSNNGLKELNTQLAREREWKKLQAAKVQQLESSLKKVHQELSSLRQRYQQLREDFQFNLAILDERDRELERYDVMTASALTVEHSRQEELNQLSMQVAKLEEQRARETEERQEELSKSRDIAAHHRLQLDELKHSMAAEIQKQTEEYERTKSHLQCRIQELEEELIRQRQETTAAFDNELRQREHEFSLRMDEMRSVVLSRDLKVKLLSKEAEVQCQAHFQKIRDLTSVKDNRIKQLEDELRCMEMKLKKTEDTYIQKYGDVVQALKDCDGKLEALRQAHTEQLRRTEKRITKLREKMEALSAQVCCRREDQQEAMQQKDETIQRIRTEVITLQEREAKLKMELERSREQIEGYKQQLSSGLKRERDLEQIRVQAELEWQRRCEDIKTQHYLANEQLIQDLTQARDQAKAELKEKEQELQSLAASQCPADTERNQAKQGLTPKAESLALEEIRYLQEQNSTLRAVVNLMRKDMEDLHSLSSHLNAPAQVSSSQPVQQPGAPVTTSVTPAANFQMASGLPARPAAISSEVNPSGCPCLEKHASTSAQMKPEIRAAHTESSPSNMQQAAQHQEENLHMQQKQVLGRVSDGVFVQDAKSNPLVLRPRLKQAAFCIARLTREKQQLIEMCNRLRFQISTAGAPAEVDRQSSTEKEGDQYNKLSALEQLQYQLTRQELEFALRQSACTSAEQLPRGTSNKDPATKQTANLNPARTDRPESSRKRGGTSPLSQSQNLLDVVQQSHSGLSKLSSEESLQSLTELWKILDHGLSPSLFSEGEGELSRREVAGSGGAEVQMLLHGSSAPIHGRPSAEVQQRRNHSTPSNFTKKIRPERMSKIRNYSYKD